MNLIHNANNYLNPFSASQLEAQSAFLDGNKISVFKRIVIIAFTIFITFTTVGFGTSTAFKLSVDLFKVRKQKDDLSEEAEASKIGNIYFNLYVALAKIYKEPSTRILCGALKRYPRLGENREFMLNFAKVDPEMAFVCVDPLLKFDVDFLKELERNLVGNMRFTFYESTVEIISDYINGELNNKREQAVESRIKASIGDSIDDVESVYNEIMKIYERDEPLIELMDRWNCKKKKAKKDKLILNALGRSYSHEVLEELSNRIHGTDLRMEKSHNELLKSMKT